MNNLPPELEEYIQNLPSALQNNAREITRANFKRILKLNPMTAARILAEKYDIHLDPDRSPYDYEGEQEQVEESKPERETKPV